MLCYYCIACQMNVICKKFFLECWDGRVSARARHRGRDVDCGDATNRDEKEGFFEARLSIYRFADAWLL
jgi:hypothetical protein